MEVTFVVRPGGTPLAEYRQAFDSLDAATQEKLLRMSAEDRTRAVGAIILARLFGETKPQECDQPTGVSGRMWGSQRAF